MTSPLPSVFTHHPSPPLGKFVEVIWLYKRAALPHARERLLPMGTTELVMELGLDTAGPYFCGPHSQAFEIETAEPATIIGVHFKPGGAFPFLHLPASELHNSSVTLDSLWGSKAAALRDRLLEEPSPAAKFCALEQALLQRARHRLAWHPAVDFALDAIQTQECPPTIADLTHRIGLSPRRFIQVFTEQVGLTPKLFCRVQRFQTVVRMLGKAKHVDLAHLALSCGYYDQAHFANDFRTFSGLSPTAYLQARGDHLNHVPLTD